MKLRILAAGVVAAMSLPATAGAAGSVSGGPVKAGGYDVSLHAVDGKQDSLTIMMQRGTQADGESQILQFTRGVDVTVRGASARIKGTLGSRGSVDLRLENARRSGREVPEGCTGRAATTRTGRLVGELRVRLPDGKLATIRSLPGSSHVGGNLDCQDRDPRPGGDGGDGNGDGQGNEPQLMASDKSDGVRFSFVATKTALTISRIIPQERDRGATVSAINSAHASGSNLLTVSDGGARAAVKPAGSFTGNGAFTATTNAGSMAMGPLTGSLRIKLSGVPVISITSENAMLMNANKG